MKRAVTKKDIEKIEEEIGFLKMKLMLEYGAGFESTGEKQIPPEIEFEFLNNVVEIEKQMASPVLIRVFDKVGKPGHFRETGAISEDEMESEWMKLLEHLHRYGIDISVCSPNVSARELYRFTVEELFQLEIQEIKIPGMVHAFIYDDFHPDPVYENTRNAEEELLPGIFHSKNELYDFYFDAGELQINGRSYSHFGAFKARIDQFKSCFDLIQLERVETRQCRVFRKTAIAEGELMAKAVIGSLQTELKAKWKIKSICNDLCGWVIKEIWLEGIDL